MIHPHIPAKAVHACHRLHTLVQRAEVAAHTAYLTMVSFGSHEYHIAAACMLGTVVVGGILHVVIDMGEKP